jgi:hypothetical protein
VIKILYLCLANVLFKEKVFETGDQHKDLMGRRHDQTSSGFFRIDAMIVLRRW